MTLSPFALIADLRPLDEISPVLASCPAEDAPADNPPSSTPLADISDESLHEIRAEMPTLNDDWEVREKSLPTVAPSPAVLEQLKVVTLKAALEARGCNRLPRTKAELLALCVAAMSSRLMLVSTKKNPKKKSRLRRATRALQQVVSTDVPITARSTDRLAVLIAKLLLLLERDELAGGEDSRTSGETAPAVIAAQ
eukprot:scaffold15374_cov129-Isochrysis_galbana.AAC.1